MEGFIELKEGRRLKQVTAVKEFKQLQKARKKFKIKRGYLLYVCRYGDKKVIKKKKKGARFFFEVP